MSFSEENLDKIQTEGDAKIEELKSLLEEAEKANIEVKNENNNIISSLQSNAEKLHEAEKNLAEANAQQEEKLKEVQELKQKCGELETELEQLRESQVKFALFHWRTSNKNQQYMTTIKVNTARNAYVAHTRKWRN